jgi:hypothetical protein
MAQDFRANFLGLEVRADVEVIQLNAAVGWPEGIETRKLRILSGLRGKMRGHVWFQFTTRDSLRPDTPAVPPISSYGFFWFVSACPKHWKMTGRDLVARS